MKPPQLPGHDDDLSSYREFIEYRFNQVDKRFDRMEQIMGNFAFVKQSDFDKLSLKVDKMKDGLSDDYVSKESMRPWAVILSGIAIAVGGAIVIGILKLMGANVL